MRERQGQQLPQLALHPATTYAQGLLVSLSPKSQLQPQVTVPQCQSMCGETEGGRADGLNGKVEACALALGRQTPEEQKFKASLGLK